MNIFIVVEVSLLIAIALVRWNLKEKKRRTIVLGTEIAEASERERQKIEGGNYLPSPLPDFDYSKWTDEQSLINPRQNELDQRITELCQSFKNCDEGKRNEIRKSINQHDIYTLLEFVKRATLFGIRNNDSSHIHDGLVAVTMIEAERCDYRDVLIALSFLNYGIQKLSLDGLAIFSGATQLSDGKTGQLIQQFAGKQVKQNSIETIGGYTGIETKYGISFINTYYKKYNPEKNLVEILIEISDYIFVDKYNKGGITIGDEIAAIWLSAEDKKIKTAMSRTTGCASLHTELKHEFDANSNMQTLLIYLAEFKDYESLQGFSQLINTAKPTSFSRLIFTEDSLFCVVIQRAIMVGVQGFETEASLKRLESPIREIIRKS